MKLVMDTTRMPTATVYFARRLSDRSIKIGACLRDPAERVASLRGPHELLAVIPGAGVEFERTLQERFSKARRHPVRPASAACAREGWTEYFWPVAGLIDYIETVAA